jgi:hypothetical protein
MGGQDTRRAEAALQRMVLSERRLQCAQRVTSCEPFDGNDIRLIRLHGKHQAGPYRRPIHDNGARATDPVLAADMCACQFKLMAQTIGERRASFHSGGDGFAIDSKSHH